MAGNGKNQAKMMPVFLSNNGERFVIACGKFIADGEVAACDLGECAWEICSHSLMFTGEATLHIVHGRPANLGICPIYILTEDE
jgi:hypothetical protein